MTTSSDPSSDPGTDREPDGARASRPSLDGPVIVGVDGSVPSQRGLHFAADLARRLDAELIVLHALGLLSHLRNRPDQEEPDGEQQPQSTADIVRDEWCASLADHEGLRWRSQTAQGSPVDAILRIADEAGAAFVVVASHGAGRSDSPFLGSTSHQIVRNSHRPVIVVPPGDNHPHRRGGAGAMSSVVADA